MTRKEKKRKEKKRSEAKRIEEKRREQKNPSLHVWCKANSFWLNFAPGKFAKLSLEINTLCSSSTKATFFFKFSLTISHRATHLTAYNSTNNTKMGIGLIL